MTTIISISSIDKYDNDNHSNYVERDICVMNNETVLNNIDLKDK